MCLNTKSKKVVNSVVTDWGSLQQCALRRKHIRDKLRRKEVVTDEEMMFLYETATFRHPLSKSTTEELINQSMKEDLQEVAGHRRALNEKLQADGKLTDEETEFLNRIRFHEQVASLIGQESGVSTDA